MRGIKQDRQYPLALVQARGTGPLYRQCVRYGADELWDAYSAYRNEQTEANWEALSKLPVTWAFREPTVAMRVSAIRERLIRAADAQGRAVPGLPTILEVRRALSA